MSFNPAEQRVTYYVKPVANTPTGVAPKKGVPPLGTVVLIWDNEGNVSRGIAICAESDQFCRNRGAQEAFVRAKDGIFTKKTKYLVGAPAEHTGVIRNAAMAFCEAWQAQWGEVPSWKQAFKPILTDFEKRLLEKARVRVTREHEEKAKKLVEAAAPVVQ